MEDYHIDIYAQRRSELNNEKLANPSLKLSK
jgi:hypothetical protein